MVPVFRRFLIPSTARDLLSGLPKHADRVPHYVRDEVSGSCAGPKDRLL
jgi:hypothetical protein